MIRLGCRCCLPYFYSLPTNGYVPENEVLGTRSWDMYPKRHFRVYIIPAPRMPLRICLYLINSKYTKNGAKYNLSGLFVLGGEGTAPERSVFVASGVPEFVPKWVILQ